MTRFAPTLLAATSALALGLAACEGRGGSARIDAPEPAPLAELSAPAVELPYAEPAPVSRLEPQRGYQWAERAYGMQRAFYDVPPDYGFEYGESEPLVWVSEDDWSMYAEPWDDGYRYYYYEPGAAYPYFVLDNQYGYGFDPSGVLIALFDVHGGYLPQDVVYRMAPVAGRYYVHGRDLRNAAVQSRRISIDQRTWADVRPQVTRGADPWLRAARDDRAWRAWRERDNDRELRRFEPEQRRREALRRVAAAQPQVPLPGVPALREDRQAQAFARRDAHQAEQMQRQAQRQALADQQRGRLEAHAQAERGHQAQLQRQQALAQQQARANRGQQAQMERQQARAQAQAERQQRATAERGRQAQIERQQARAQAERGRQAQMQQARAQAQAERRQQAQAERGRQAQMERQQVRAQAERQQQARAAEQQGRMAAAREQAQVQRAQAAQPRAQAPARERGKAAAHPNGRDRKDRGQE